MHKRGIESDKNEAKAIIEAKPPTNKKEAQRFMGQIRFFCRFIANLTGKVLVFVQLLRLWKQEFVLQAKDHKAFWRDQGLLDKDSTSSTGSTLKLYVVVEESIESFLAQDNEECRKQAVYYISLFLNAFEIKYSPMA